MNTKRCCFAGHSKIYDDSVRDTLKEIITDLIEKENVKEFWVGRYGQFDNCCTGVVRELKTVYPDIRLELIIPYLTKAIELDIEQLRKNYNSILISDIPENTPKKFKILKTNEYMVNNSDFIVCYVDHSWGGAVKTLEYARKKKHIKIINIGCK